MEFCEGKNGLEIKDGEKVIYQFNHNDFLCKIGIGKNDYSMSHGSFNISEKISYTREFRVKLYNIDGNHATLSTKPVKFDLEINGNILKVTPTVPVNFNRLWVRIRANDNECVYGCGEQFTELNLRGKNVNVWVAEHINALQTAKKIAKQVLGVRNTQKKQRFSNYETYYSEPTFLSSRKYFFHSSSTARCEFDFTNSAYHEIKMDSIAPFYIGIGETFEDVLTNLTALLGRQPQLPDWVFDGSILGIQGGTETMLTKVNKCLKAQTAVNGVWIQDWEGRRVTAVGKQLQWNWQWDSELYPNLDKEIKNLNEIGIKVLGYINPFLAVEKPLYKEAHDKGYCVKNKAGDDYYVTITTFPAAMIDLTNRNAYEWIKGIIKRNLIDFGFSGWMADFGEYLPTDCVLASGEDPELVHNTWPALWAKANREAVEEAGKLGEIMFFTRAGFTDTKKYSTMMWNGDNHVDYSIDFGIPSVIPAMLSLSCCGFGLSHSDIGGYTTIMNLSRTPELFMRWCEMNAFSPLMRSHEGLNPDANAQFDYNEEVLNHHAKMSRIHKALKPYLKACDKENAELGIPIVRPLFFYYDEKKAYNEAYEYLLGRDILVAPVISEGATTRDVYFPNDTWVHIWSGEEFTKGIFEVNAPVGEPPVFIRKGAKNFNELMNITNA